MAKKRTRKQKVRTGQRLAGMGGFKVSFGAMDGSKTKEKAVKKEGVEAKYFRSDLTKVIVLTMLALALEIALWLYLAR
ncbi:MAG TPA: hypothetical protein VI791_00070 [Patescibacteria group bacterium]|nr:hypothetical protein [Patescibacteria group bacterium]